MHELNGEDVFQTFMNAYASAIDPHTDYLTPRSADNFNMAMRLSLEGIGAVLQKQDDVRRDPRTSCRAARPRVSGKLKAGDRIVGVGQGDSGAMEDVVGWRIDDVGRADPRREGHPGAAGRDPGRSRRGRQADADRARSRDKVQLEEQAAKAEVDHLPAADGGRRAASA